MLPAVRLHTHQFSTGIAFHGLSLAVPCEMIWTTALVARSRSRIAWIASAESWIEAATSAANTGTALHSCIGAIALRHGVRII